MWFVPRSPCASPRSVCLPLRDIGFHADDRLDARAFHLVVERDRAIHIAVIGYGNGARARFLRACGQRLYLDRAVEKTEIRMKMEVNKIFFVHCFF